MACIWMTTDINWNQQWFVIVVFPDHTHLLFFMVKEETPVILTFLNHCFQTITKQ